MKQRVYIDTSVVRGYFDEEFKEVTIQYFVKGSGQMVDLNCKEKPQKTNSKIVEILNNNYA